MVLYAPSFPTLQKSTFDFEHRTIIKPWSNLIFIHGWTRTIVSLFSLQFTCNEKMTISATKKKEFSTRYGCILNLDSEIMTIKYWVVGGARMRLEWNYIAMNVRIDKTLVTEITCYLLAVFYYVIFYSIRRISAHRTLNDRVINILLLSSRQKCIHVFWHNFRDVLNTNMFFVKL